MRQTQYYWITIIAAVNGVMFLLATETNPLAGIMAVASFAIMAIYSDLYSNEKLKHIRSNADEDRPE